LAILAFLLISFFCCVIQAGAEAVTCLECIHDAVIEFIPSPLLMSYFAPPGKFFLFFLTLALALYASCFYFLSRCSSLLQTGFFILCCVLLWVNMNEIGLGRK